MKKTAFTMCLTIIVILGIIDYICYLVATPLVPIISAAIISLLIILPSCNTRS
jgi:hypothetical protein